MIDKKDDSRKHYDNLSKVVIQYLGGKRYTPESQAEIFKKLSIPPTLRQLCKEILDDLVQKGVAVLKNRKYALKAPEAKFITGTVRVHPRGFGFVQPDHPLECPQDIFIPKHMTDNAVDGDQVEVEMSSPETWERGPEGRIISVIKRGRTHLAGTIHFIDAKGKIFVHCPLLGTSKPVIIHSKKKMRVGDRVILKVDEWGDEEKATLGEVSDYIGHISDPTVDN